MKYGESAFDILYLLFAVTGGCIIMQKAGNRTEKLMGIAAVVLGCGDAFHLVPRVMNYFSDADLAAALGIGKLVTSVTMTVFYLILYYVCLGVYKVPQNRNITVCVWVLTAVRIVLCLFPQNGWLTNGNDLTWAIIRNVPFVILGAVVCALWFSRRKDIPQLRSVWLYILLSFAFYIPVAVGAGIVPILGMLMLPKTICYIAILYAFWKYVSSQN